MGILYSSIHIVRNLYCRNMLFKCQLFKRAQCQLLVTTHAKFFIIFLFSFFSSKPSTNVGKLLWSRTSHSLFRHTHKNIPTCGVQRNCPEVFQFCRCTQTDSAEFNIKIYHMQGYVCGCGLQMLDMVVLEHTPSLPCFCTFFTSSSLYMFLNFPIYRIYRMDFIEFELS